MGGLSLKTKGELREALRTNARRMYFSYEVIDNFLSEVPLAHMRAVNSLVQQELVLREVHKREQMVRRAKLSKIKSFADFDYLKLRMPEGYVSTDLESLKFIDHAEGFIFYGKEGRGKTHLAIAAGIAAVEAGIKTRFFRVCPSHDDSR